MTQHPPRRFHPTHRLGLLVPSANPAVEPEMRALLPSSLGLHAARLPVMQGTTLRQRSAAYLAAAERAVGDFGDLPLDMLALGLTAPSYALAPTADHALQDRLSAQSGRPFLLASRGIAQALAALGRPRLLVFSPYPGWLTDQAEAYWRAAGLDLAESFAVSDRFRAYDLTPEEVAEGLGRLAPPADAVVLLSGTGMATLDAIAWMRGRVAVPLLSSNIACAFAACRALGLPPGEALGACAPELARLLPG